jgi:hypothetical protein
VAATAADFPERLAEPTRLGRYPIRRRLSRQEADLNAANAAAHRARRRERRVQRRMRGNLQGYEGLAGPFARARPLRPGGSAGPCDGASAALHGLPVVTTTGGAARLASAPSPCQRGSREILRQAPSHGGTTLAAWPSFFNLATTRSAASRSASGPIRTRYRNEAPLPLEDTKSEASCGFR